MIRNSMLAFALFFSVVGCASAPANKTATAPAAEAGCGGCAGGAKAGADMGCAEGEEPCADGEAPCADGAKAEGCGCADTASAEGAGCGCASGAPKE
jgi:hypothetical protein